jgi:hypothetical protein
VKAKSLLTLAAIILALLLTPNLVFAACKASDLLFTQWPLGGAPSKDWVISCFVDDDPGANSVRDSTGQTGTVAATYDGHTGTDLMIPGFKQMDEGVPVYAAAGGVIYASHDGNPDRNETFPGCSADSGSYVEIRHANGFISEYDHMKSGTRFIPGKMCEPGSLLEMSGAQGVPPDHTFTLRFATANKM